LEDLVRTQDIKKVVIKRVLSRDRVDMDEAAGDNKWSKWSSPKGGAEDKREAAFGAEVGVGEDWDHLNRRRRRAREEKVERDVRWMRKS
jgi:hypothetical protein